MISASPFDTFPGLPPAVLLMAGFAVAAGAIFYLINQMKP